MKPYIITFTISILITAGAYAVEHMPKFQPKLQIGQHLSIDKLREQNLNVVQKAVEGIRENLPQRVDDYTKLVAVDSNGTTLIYIFEVKSDGQSDMQMAEQGKRMVPRIHKGICLSSKRFLQADIALRYRYVSSSTRSEILRVDVDKSKCETLWNSVP